MTRKEREAAEKARHEYILMEIRLSAEDQKAEIKQYIDQKFVPCENRLTELEHWRTKMNGVTTGLALGWSALLAYLQYVPKKGSH